MNDKLKEFEKWLRQIDLLEYYQNNPEQQQSIFNDYKSDLEYIDPKYHNEWFTLIDKDIEWVKTNYPETMKGLDERIKEWPPYVTAAHIHQIPEVFTKWKTNIDNYLKSTIDKDIRAFSKLIDLILYRLEFNSDVVNNAVNKIKPELLEMEDYLKRLLIKRPKQQTKTSYIWPNNPDKELPKLYAMLTNEYKLISSETTLDQFTKTFTGQPTEGIKPITWINTNRLLAYFLDCVFVGKDWQSQAGKGKLFRNKNKCLTANDLSVAKKGYTDFGLPKGYENIDYILKAIKKD
tara:strand:+ start:800 stop:1672 length:873 start_codon:yes stop_codon:yes gene_type:complete